MIYTLLSLSPLSPLRVLARLACLIHAANVHSEPESNPSIDVSIIRGRTFPIRRKLASRTEWFPSDSGLLASFI
jgi:hypothetical protein